MKVLTVKVTDDEYCALLDKVDFIKANCPFCGVVRVSNILEHYIADLTESDRSSGSDECMYAYQYFERDLFNY